MHPRIFALILCIASVNASASFTGLSYDYIAYDAINGNVTVRIYAEFSNASDQLTAIYGNNITPLQVIPSGTFYQNGFGGPTSLTINPAFYAFFPDLVYDSWFTIGLQDVTANMMVTLGLDFAAFEMGGSISEADAAGGQITTLAGSAQNFPVAGRVLIAQFTTNNDVAMLMNFTWRDAANTLFQATGITLNINGGDPGCNDAFASNFDAAATLNDGSCIYPAPSYTGITGELVAYNSSSNYFNTYRVYAHFAMAGDQLTALFGKDVTPLSIVTTGTFFQHPLGAFTSDGINASLFNSFPELEYDSWVSVGPQSGPNGVETIGVNPSSFESGESLLINDQYGGSWFVFPGSEPLAFPDTMGRVLIAQITADDDITISLNLQYRAANGTDPQHLAQTIFIDHLRGGCTDVAACNFDAMAEVNDGSCFPPILYFMDNDGDGFGDPSVSSSFCTPPVSGFVLDDTDCDDGRNDVHPGAPGTAEAIDNNCNMLIDPEEELQDYCAGDFDDNGVINTSDLLLFMAQFGCSNSCGNFDLDDNGPINTGDLLLFMALFGTSCP
ncbi:MAG: hypothetical protein SH856_00015 [Flavobacteriales bacterium]|nr:hypothetical protein [Flavobacteriales bacterium]